MRHKRVIRTVLPVGQQLAIDIQQCLAVIPRNDNVVVPNFLEQRLTGHTHSLLIAAFKRRRAANRIRPYVLLQKHRIGRRILASHRNRQDR